MNRWIFGAVADDDTGATDLAGMLAEEGLRTVLVIDPPEPGGLAQWAHGHDAVIVGAGTRALAPAEAYRRTRAAVGELKKLDPRVIEIKYCSTFDSTPEGNIGPSIDAAMDELGAGFTVALPALPVNGRTTYMGHHFVNGQLLSDSPMRCHPLTPMTNPNLVTHLQSQTKRRVGLAAYPVSRDKLESLKRGGTEIAVLDCIGDADLDNVCSAIADLRLITGSSAPAMRLPAVWRREGWWTPAEPVRVEAVGAARGYLVVAGSCSVATRGQNAWLTAQGAVVLTLDALDLLGGVSMDGVADCAASALHSGKTCLVRTASEPEDIARVQAWSRARGRDDASTGLEIAYALARLVREVMVRAIPGGLIVAGGETAGAVCRTLNFGALEIGRNIEPGVPACIALGGFRTRVALKSGNFGSPDFYGRAIHAFS